MTQHSSRREFLKLAGMAGMSLPFTSWTNETAAGGIAIVVAAGDPIATAAPALWAAQELEQALTAQHIPVTRHENMDNIPSATLIILAAGAGSPMAKNISNTQVPDKPESLGLIPATKNQQQIILACGHDTRGLVYALLELSDRVRHSRQPLTALHIQQPIIEQPVNSIRSLNRLFVSDVEDKPWYNDRDMWPAYLTMLATQRYNRFNLSFGIGYDFLQKVTDSYFLFAYPFLLDVPGYNVKAAPLPDTERDANLTMLKYISEETVKRGLQFQLGIWMHGYEWLNTTHANYTIEGLTKDNHAAYCRDALRLLLQTCPAISGVTLRVHGESGVNEGSYAFWSTIFDGVKTCGRKVEIDMHAKGMDQSMIDAAVGTGMPVVISPKYWAEHMGMPYHQADIRELEVPHANQKASTLMNLSAGSRSFLRYGYGDLLRTDRPYKVIHRIWPGTQRLLLWGDPVTAAAHAKAFSFCGSDGVELMEPLSFKGRRGSGIAGDRCGYTDAACKPKWDWEKYLYTLRIFGRMTYNPATAPDGWQRHLKQHFGAGAAAAESALANVSRILPTVLTTHGASAGNNMYWPEMYTNQPITDPALKNTYTDTPAPKTFGNVTPLDPQLFLGINAFVKESLENTPSGKYTPLEVAQWLEDYATTGATQLAAMKAQTPDRQSPEYRRMTTDISMQVGLGHFWAEKFRAGVLYAIYEQSHYRPALEQALKYYRNAQKHYTAVAGTAKNIYIADITVGELPWLRGHWSDRLPALDEDVQNMAAKLAAHKDPPAQDTRAVKAVQKALGKPIRLKATCRHTPPVSFTKGQAVPLAFTFDGTPHKATLYYRHVTQAERYRTADITLQDSNGQVSIPGDYTDSPYPLEYYLIIEQAPDTATLYPGFNTTQAGQPYLVIKEA